VNNLRILEYKTLKLSYLVKGTGSKGLICFHGYGRKADDFMALNLTSGIKIISINLPFHSESQFEEKNPEKTLWKEDLIHCVSKIIKDEKVESIFLVGFSLGAKAVLTLLETTTFSIQGAVLFAPDGFKSNPWYWFASQTKFGEFLNRSSIRQPWVFNTFIKISKIGGFASERQLNFAKQQMDSAEKRELVFNIWRAHRKLNVNLNKVKSRIHREGILMRIILGRFDKIIPSVPIQKWVESSNESLLIEEKCGHQIPIGIIEKHVLELIQ